MLKASAAEQGGPLGLVSQHPLAASLEVGGRVSAELALVFIDLTQFTGRTFWDDLDDVTSLAHAVLSSVSSVVTRLGGHVLGLRGDGVFAGFGPTVQPEVAVALAAAACAACLDSVQRVLNPNLVRQGIEPVQIRAGADFGLVNFVRTGTAETSEVNVVGFAANFAAKCEKYANSWELVVGQEFARYIIAKDSLRSHRKSPKPYMRNYERRTYNFYCHHWRPLVEEVDDAARQIDGRPLESLEFRSMK